MNYDGKTERFFGDVVARYEKRFMNDRLGLNAMVGASQEMYRSKNFSATKYDMIDLSLNVIDAAIGDATASGSSTEWAMRSFFGRINSAYKSKYLFEANLRYDGNSRYHEDYRWGTFPSASAAWRISEEGFMENTRNWLDNLKVRLSYGSVGNDGGTDVGDYEYQSTYGTARYSFGGILTSGLASTSLANSMLSWETSTMMNFGIDLNALNNRLSFTFDAFRSNTTGILYRPSIYMTVGNKTAPRQNLAEMVKKGVELTLGWQDKVGEVSYSVTGNFSYTPNKVTKYKGKYSAGYNDAGEWSSNLGEVASSTSAVNPVIEGNIKGEYYLKNPYKGTGKGFAADGINGGPVDGMIRTESDMEWVQAMIAEGYSFLPNKTVGKDKIWYGDYVYADANGDGIYGGSDDREFQGISSDPKYNFGLQMSAAWKDFDISMNWAGAAGFKLYWGSSTGYNSPTTRVGVALGTDIALNHYFFDPENPTDARTNINAKYGRLVNGESGFQNTETSSLYLFNGNYLKLKNLTVGYTLPAAVSKKAYMDNLRLYVSIENVFNITKYPGQDPELGAYPEYTSLRQFAFGVNVTF